MPGKPGVLKNLDNYRKKIVDYAYMSHNLDNSDLIVVSVITVFLFSGTRKK